MRKTIPENKRVPVVILCGGRGTRLKEETEVIPKPLVLVGERPILWHIMKIYTAYGFRHFILPVGYRGEKIKEYFLNYFTLQGDFTIDLKGGKRRINTHTLPCENWTVTIADTGPDAETGARIKRIEQYVKHDTFLMTYGDGVSSVDMEKLLRFHFAQGKTVTVTGVHPPARFGEIQVKNTLAVKFSEKPQLRQGYINGGFFVLQRKIFDYLKSDPSFNFERDVLPNVAKDRELAVFCHDGFWQCMDTIRDMERLNNMWATGNVPWKVWT